MFVCCLLFFRNARSRRAFVRTQTFLCMLSGCSWSSLRARPCSIVLALTASTSFGSTCRIARFDLMLVTTSREHKALPWGWCPKRSRGFSFKPEAMISMTEIQSCDANFNWARMERVTQRSIEWTIRQWNLPKESRQRQGFVVFEVSCQGGRVLRSWKVSFDRRPRRWVRWRNDYIGRASQQDAPNHQKRRDPASNSRWGRPW